MRHWVDSVDHCFVRGDNGRDRVDSVENSLNARDCDSNCSHGQPFFK